MQTETDERRRGPGRRATDVTRSEHHDLVTRVDALQAEVDRCTRELDIQFKRMAAIQATLDRVTRDRR